MQVKIEFLFLINDLQKKVPCVSFYVDFVVSRCSNRIIISLFRMLLYVRVHSAYLCVRFVENTLVREEFLELMELTKTATKTSLTRF
jgi:hypothetical protein